MNIVTKLKELGVEITDDISKAFQGEFVSKAEMDKKVQKAEAERDDWKQKAETSEETLKGFEGKDFDQITKDRDEWKQKYEDLDKASKEKAAADEKKALLDEAMKEYKFTSKAAEASIRASIEKDVTVKDGKLIGFSDLINSAKESDKEAFADEKEGRKAYFSTESGKGEESISGDPNTMDYATYKKWRNQNK